MDTGADKQKLLTCCPRFIAKQEQETPNWNRKTIKRMTMYWEQRVKETMIRHVTTTTKLQQFQGRVSTEAGNQDTKKSMT